MKSSATVCFITIVLVCVARAFKPNTHSAENIAGSMITLLPEARNHSLHGYLREVVPGLPVSVCLLQNTPAIQCLPAVKIKIKYDPTSCPAII